MGMVDGGDKGGGDGEVEMGRVGDGDGRRGDRDAWGA